MVFGILATRKSLTRLSDVMVCRLKSDFFTEVALWMVFLRTVACKHSRAKATD